SECRTIPNRKPGPEMDRGFLCLGKSHTKNRRLTIVRSECRTIPNRKPGPVMDRVFNAWDKALAP
ncbi:MAG: hypothetical protein R3309_10845, partial [Reinekea sp.]|nr:hypothetical protein [Reinekea sp.]